jgi:hypothetical protein
MRKNTLPSDLIVTTVIHLATPYLPFGGVGNSGMGSYHGKTSFEPFSHKKSILKKSTLLDVRVRYAPVHHTPSDSDVIERVA